MARKNKNQMTDKQFQEAIAGLNGMRPAKRGGRATVVIKNKKKAQNKRACRERVDV